MYMVDPLNRVADLFGCRRGKKALSCGPDAHSDCS